MNFEDRVVVVVNVAVAASAEKTREHLSHTEHIGALCSTSFAAEGAKVVIVDSDETTMARLAAEARARGGHLTPIPGNPADPRDLQCAAEECLQRYGKVDALLNCHYDSEVASFEASSPQSWERVVKTNLLGPVYASKAFLELLKAGDGRAIVHVGSIDGTLGNPQIPSYSAAKGGLVPLTHVMAEELGMYGIRVNCVARGMMVRAGAPVAAMYQPLIEHTPLGRPAYPHEVVNAIRFLASPEASYISGVVLPVDGGRTGVTQGTRPGPGSKARA